MEAYAFVPEFGIDFDIAALFVALDAQRRNRALSWQGLPRNYGISPHRLTRNVRITQLVRRRSPAWRNGGTPPANMRSLCFAGWAARQRAS